MCRMTRCPRRWQDPTRGRNELTVDIAALRTHRSLGAYTPRWDRQRSPRPPGPGSLGKPCLAGDAPPRRRRPESRCLDGGTADLTGEEVGCKIEAPRLLAASSTTAHAARFAAAGNPHDPVPRTPAEVSCPCKFQI